QVDTSGLTVLHRVSEQGDIPLLKMLLEERAKHSVLKLEADVDVTCLERGWTPLMYAASNGHIDAVHALLEKGARVTKTSNPT
ncbi:unnamed protein product, partial [Choristocarpus tenellus]